ncbi:hypothetical protein [Clostridium botulinum]
MKSSIFLVYKLPLCISMILVHVFKPIPDTIFTKYAIIKWEK